jgi:hypothetical protein
LSRSARHLTRRLFYFITAEGERTIASQEANFAVPTVEQRGLFRSGATGLFRDPFTGELIINEDTDRPSVAVPSTRNGSAIFSLFPLPNNPQGVYGPNTFTQVLPASGQGKILSAKLDGNFKYASHVQSSALVLRAHAPRLRRDTRPRFLSAQH